MAARTIGATQDSNATASAERQLESNVRRPALMLRNRSQYPSWQRRHEAVLLYIAKNPAAKLCAIAKAADYSETHVSRIVNSPEFHRRYRLVADRVLCNAIAERLRKN